MDVEPSSISTIPYCVIRTEKDNIHSVCIGSPLSVLTKKFENPPLPATIVDEDPESAFEASSHKPPSSSSSVKSSINNLNGFGNSARIISTPIGSKGIFDDSSDDEYVDTSTESQFVDQKRTEYSFESTTKEFADLRPISTFTSKKLSNPNFVLAGCANGTICIYESETGRLLDRVEQAHGLHSVLIIEELRASADGIYFASQGRDGYVRFWSIRIEKGTADFPTLPALAVKGERFVIRPHSSPVFVGGEAFCKASFNKRDGLVATVVERGSIAIWDYETVLDLVAKGDVEFRPKCIVMYDGEKYGMSMSLQLLESSENREAALVVGFEDGSVLVWSLTKFDNTDENGKKNSSLLYTQIASSRPFATTPVLSISLRCVSEILKHQSLTPEVSQDKPNIPYVDATSSEDSWIGVATSAEDKIVTFCFSWDFAHNVDSIPSGSISTLETYQLPHQGYGDVKIRDDSLVAIAGWDFRIRLFLFEAAGESNNKITFQLRPLAILRHHTASVHSISLGNAETQLLASGSKDQRIALWHIY